MVWLMLDTLPRWVQWSAILSMASFPQLAQPKELVLGWLGPQGADSWQVELFSQFKLAIQDVNADPNMLQDTTLDYLVRDTGPPGLAKEDKLAPGGVVGDEMVALTGALELVEEGVVGIVGTAFSIALPFSAGHASALNLPIVSPSSTAVSRSDKTRYPYLMRMAPNDAVGIKAMVVATNDLGWREAAVIVHTDFYEGFTQVMRPGLESLGIGYLSLVQQNPVDEDSASALQQVVTIIASSGYRVILLYTFPTLLEQVNLVTAGAGLRTELHSWVIYNPVVEEIFLEEWGATPDTIIVVVPHLSTTDNPVYEAYLSHWQEVSQRYNASVHGTFNVTSHDPFFGSSTYSPVFWDLNTNYPDKAGDEIPDDWGLYAYDIVWLYARAIQALEARGIEPVDGEELRLELLAQNFTGVSGFISFDQTTQDRLQDLQIILLQSSSERPVIANITPKLTQTAVGEDGWCVTGCTTLGETGLDHIPWPAGRLPTDGRGLDHGQSSFFSASAFEEENPIEITVHVQNAFQRPPCESPCHFDSPQAVCDECLSGILNYSLIEPHFRDAATNETILLASPVERAVDYARGTLVITCPTGLQGSGDQDRTVALNIMYEGQFLDDGDKQIQLLSQSCTPGYKTASLGRCEPCPPGSYSEMRGSTQCESCPPGTVQGEAGATSCMDCPQGHFANSTGLKECKSCAQGTFQEEARKSYCTACTDTLPGGSTTLILGATSPDACVCKEDYYFHRDSPGGSPSCANCPKGLLCHQGTGPPLQAGGYHAAEQAFEGAAPSFVVLCTMRQNCPDGTALGTCPDRREGLACDECEIGWYDDGDGRCAECNSGAVALPLSLLIIGGLIFIVLLYYFSTRPLSVTSQNVATLAITGSLVVTSLQIISAFNELSLAWEEPMLALRSFLSLFVFRVSYLNPGCTFQTNSPAIVFALSLSIYPLALLALFFGFGMARKCGRDVTVPQLYNAVGLGMLVFYLSLAMASMQPLRCTENPDGTHSVVQSRSILCWEEDHWAMVALALLAVLIYVVPFFCLVIYLTVVYPRKIVRDGAKFVRRTEFLFKRFKSAYYYYGLVFLSRNLIIASIPVIFASWGEVQVMAMMLVIVVTHSTTCRFFPWRTRIANGLDIFISLGLISVLISGAVLTTFNASRAMKIIQMMIATTLVCMVIAAAGIMGYSLKAFLFPAKRYGVFLSHHKGAAQVLARWFKLCLREQTAEEIFLDSDNLEELSTLLQIVAFETKNLVILLTRQTLSRLWCACEIVTAYKAGVNILLVSCDGTEAPSDDQISDVVDMWTGAQTAELTTLGVDIEHMRQAFRALRDLPLLRVKITKGKGAENGIIEEVMAQLKGCGASGFSSLRSRGTASALDEDAAVVQVLLGGNLSDPEASCCAQVVKRMLMQTNQLPSAIVGEDDADHSRPHARAALSDAKVFVALLSRGVLENPVFAATIAQVYVTGIQMALIPMVVDGGFHFPDDDFWTDLQQGKVIAKDHPILAEVSLADVEEAYQALFKAIALKFTEHGSEMIQQAEINALNRRIASIMRTIQSL